MMQVGGYFELPAAGPHSGFSKPPQSPPYSRSKSVWIFLVLFLAWGVTMTAVYVNRTTVNNNNTTDCSMDLYSPIPSHNMFIAEDKGGPSYCTYGKTVWTNTGNSGGILAKGTFVGNPHDSTCTDESMCYIAATDGPNGFNPPSAHNGHVIPKNTHVKCGSCSATYNYNKGFGCNGYITCPTCSDACGTCGDLIEGGGGTEAQCSYPPCQGKCGCTFF